MRAAARPEKGRPYRRNLAVWAALLLLLAATAGSAYLPLGNWNAVLNLGIAAAKALLVGVFFMHLRRAEPLVRLAAAISIFMLAILFGLAATDFLARRIHPAPWQEPRQLQGGPARGRAESARIAAGPGCTGETVTGHWKYCSATPATRAGAGGRRGRHGGCSNPPRHRPLPAAGDCPRRRQRQPSLHGGRHGHYCQ